MTDEKRNVVWRAEYKPFGEEFEVTQDPENNRMFVGKEMDKETGLYYFGARYMEPMIGRFVSPDPVGAVDPNTGKINQIIIHDPQRINSYVYGLNNPHKYIDADGEEAVAITLGVVIAAYGPLIVTGIKAAVITLVGVGAAKTAVEAYNASKSEGKEKSIEDKGKPGTYAPERPLPRDETGKPVPESENPHTQLGTRTSKKTGEKYTQGREFGEGGKHIKDIDFTNHGRSDHPNPHEHRIDPKTGKRLGAEPFK
jgi:RHS repeat-associated protein